MFRILLRREMQSHLLSHRFYVCLVTATVLIVVTALLLSQHQANKWSEYRAAVSAQERFLDEYAHFNRLSPMVRPLMPPARLGTLFAGPADPHEFGTIYNDPLRALFSPVDLIFIVAILMSLFAIILSYDAVCGEREQGTLRLVLTYPLGRAKLLLAKLTAGFFILSLSLLVAFGCGVLVVRLTSGLAWQGTEWTGLILALVATLLYVQGFFTLGVLISASAKDSSNAVFAGLLAWGFFVLLVPSVAPSLAERLYPTPSANVVEAKVRQLDLQREIDLRSIRQQLEAEGLPEAELARCFDGEVTRVNQEHREAVTRVREPFEASLEKQTTVGWLLASVSPYTNYVAFASGASGTGVQRQASFRKQASRFYHAFWQFVTPRVEKLKEAYPLDYSDRRLDLGGRPVFTFQEPLLEERLGALGIFNLALLVFFSVLFFSGAFVKFLRYDPR